ncbi:MAG TPA: exosortase F system-associated protein [Chryseolinea sp.]|nr:exosortase F system-associated protein [Chryseolinea sp.]
MKVTRWIVALLSIAGLLLVFLFQKIDVAAMLGVGAKGIDRFLVNRMIRFLINDALAVALIYALFVERKYVVFALYVQLVGVFLFLIPYFILKVYYPGYNGPLISFLHRLILNPTLLMLLIPALYYQKHMIRKSGGV